MSKGNFFVILILVFGSLQIYRIAGNIGLLICHNLITPAVIHINLTQKESSLKKGKKNSFVFFRYLNLVYENSTKTFRIILTRVV